MCIYITVSWTTTRNNIKNTQKKTQQQHNRKKCNINSNNNNYHINKHINKKKNIFTTSRTTYTSLILVYLRLFRRYNESWIGYANSVFFKVTTIWTVCDLPFLARSREGALNRNWSDGVKKIVQSAKNERILHEGTKRPSTKVFPPIQTVGAVGGGFPSPTHPPTCASHWTILITMMN